VPGIKRYLCVGMQGLLQIFYRIELPTFPGTWVTLIAGESGGVWRLWGTWDTGILGTCGLLQVPAVAAPPLSQTAHVAANPRRAWVAFG
jgi:hypothetical protein